MKTKGPAPLDPTCCSQCAVVWATDALSIIFCGDVEGSPIEAVLGELVEAIACHVQGAQKDGSLDGYCRALRRSAATTAGKSLISAKRRATIAGASSIAHAAAIDKKPPLQ